MKAKFIIAGIFTFLSLTVFSQYTRNDNQNSNPYFRSLQSIDGTGDCSIQLKNGELWSCGRNNYGQLGIGNNTNQTTPVQIGSDDTWQVFTGGTSHVLAIKANGTLWAWGNNSKGQLGNGASANLNTPNQVGTDNKWVMVSAGENYSVGLKSDGTIWSWGDNTGGKLGIGSTTNQSTPVQVGSSADWKYIATGQYQTFAIKANGTLWAWGYNGNGSIGDGTTTNRLSPVQIGSDNNWLKISTGGATAIGLKTNSEIYGWGLNTFGQLGLGNTTNQLSPTYIGSNYQDIECSGSTFGIKNGQLYSWGANAYGQLGHGNTTNLNTPTLVDPTTNTVSVSLVGSSVFRVLANGNIETCGYNAYGQLGLGNTAAVNTFTLRSTAPTAWINIEMGYYTKYGVKQNGTIWAWGGDFTTTPTQQGTDSDWVSFIRAKASSNAKHYALKADGTLWLYDGTAFTLTSSQTFRSIYSNSVNGMFAITTDGDLWQFTNTTSASVLSTSGDWVRAGGAGSGSSEFVVALKNNGTVWVTGTNYNGAYGNGTTSTVAGFNQTTISNVIGIATCNFMPYAITVDGKVMAWGSNTYGELRNGSTVAYSTTPVQLTNGTNIIKFDCDNEGYDYAIKGDGTLWHCGGFGGDGPTNPSVLTQHSTMTDVVNINKGAAQGAVIKAQRDVICLTQLAPNYNFDCTTVTAIKQHDPTYSNSTQKDLNISENNTFDVYPVPSTGKINMKATDDSDIQSVEVMDIQGTIVYRLSSDRINEIDLSNLPKGSYFIRMKTETQTENRKIVLM